RARRTGGPRRRRPGIVGAMRTQAQTGPHGEQRRARAFRPVGPRLRRSQKGLPTGQARRTRPTRAPGEASHLIGSAHRRGCRGGPFVRARRDAPPPQCSTREGVPVSTTPAPQDRSHELVVVANRLPVDSRTLPDGATEWVTSPGGLVTAMESVMRTVDSGAWVGWAGAPGEPPAPFEADGMS